MQIASLLLPELILAAVACFLLMLGTVNRASARRAAPVVAVATLALVVLMLAWRTAGGLTTGLPVTVSAFTEYVKLLTALLGIVLLLLAWPTRADATGNDSLDYGSECGEFFALALLSLCGVMLVAGADDMVLLFLGLELVSIPTYVMVSISRPAIVAQEAGVKYFFLGALSAGLMLFGFSYLYGATGTIRLSQVAVVMYTSGGLGAWHLLGVVMLLAGLAFKIAAVPLHFYAGDVYEGAATPVTAFLAFVPKAAGFVAIIKILSAVAAPTGTAWAMPPQIFTLLWVMAALTMTVGNCLGLLQRNIKRVLAYSSIAHSGYMLVGLAALGVDAPLAIQGVLFYLAAYGVMNVGAFGVLMLLPSRRGAGTADEFDDIAGVGRHRPGLGLAMAVSCFSLLGLPLTTGFLGKILLIKPALFSGQSAMVWLAVITVLNAAVSAGYYLRIVASLFLEADGQPDEQAPPVRQALPWPIKTAVAVSVAGTLLLGAVPIATQAVLNEALAGALATQPPVLQHLATQPVVGAR